MPARRKATPVSPPPARGEATRAKLIEVAHGLFLKNGFHGTRMRQIADEAGLALGGIYNHFDNKEAIFAAVLDAYHPYHTVLPALEQVTGATPEEFMQNAAGIIQQGMAMVEVDLLPLLFMEMVEFQGRHLKDMARRLLPALMTIMHRFPAQRRTRRLAPPVLLRTFADLIIGHMITEMILRNSALLPSADINWFGGMIDIYLHGIVAHPET